MSQFLSDLRELIRALGWQPPVAVPIRFTTIPDPLWHEPNLPIDEVPIVFIDGIPYCYPFRLSPTTTELRTGLQMLRKQWPTKIITIGYYNNFFDFEPVELFESEHSSSSSSPFSLPSSSTAASSSTQTIHSNTITSVTLSSPLTISTSSTEENVKVVDALIHGSLDAKTTQLLRLAVGRHIPLDATVLTVPTQLPGAADLGVQTQWMVLQRNAKKIYGRTFPHTHPDKWPLLRGQYTNPEIAARLMKLGYLPSFEVVHSYYDTYQFKYVSEKFLKELESRTVGGGRPSNEFKRWLLFVLETLGIYNKLVYDAKLFKLNQMLLGHLDDDPSYGYFISEAIHHNNFDNKTRPELSNIHEVLNTNYELATASGYQFDPECIRNGRNVSIPFEDTKTTLMRYPHPHPFWTFHTLNRNIMVELTYDQLLFISSYGAVPLDAYEDFDTISKLMADPAVPLRTKMETVMHGSDHWEFPFELHHILRLYYTASQHFEEVNRLPKSIYYKIEDLYTNQRLAALFQAPQVYLPIALENPNVSWFEPNIKTFLLRCQFVIEDGYIFLAFDEDLPEIYDLADVWRVFESLQLPRSTRDLEHSVILNDFYDLIPVYPQLLDYIETSIH